ncbi:hypothetical protein CY0110_10182 [Crocosphaera chwakensis CCY0110]|uniref:Uncharacterized protein n=1 Tax=Crocosphaera chwakensis CCY0110 TaxID=391612 RepID=A3IGZ3_9CHRO|nr:hypothetical protein CY0110_10182 [Crocosphaera chwakensis CCY0110]
MGRGNEHRIDFKILKLVYFPVPKRDKIETITEGFGDSDEKHS